MLWGQSPVGHGRWRSTRVSSTRLSFMLVHSCSPDGPPGCPTGPVPLVPEARCEVGLSRSLPTARPGRGRCDLHEEGGQHVQGPAVVCGPGRPQTRSYSFSAALSVRLGRDAVWSIVERSVRSRVGVRRELSSFQDPSRSPSPSSTDLPSGSILRAFFPVTQ